MEKTGSEILFYILHFDRPVSGKTHYSGTTTGARLADRMREHQLGNGASLTRRAHLYKTGFRLSALIPLSSRLEEKNLKKAGHLKNRCIVCAQGDNREMSLLCNERFEAVPVMDGKHLNFTVLPSRPKATSP